MRIFYGYDTTHYKDVTSTAIEKSSSSKILTIPPSDYERAELFGDPYPGFLKHICIEDSENKRHIFNVGTSVKIEFTNTSNSAREWYTKTGRYIQEPIPRLLELQKLLRINHGDFRNEFVEQIMCMEFINENAKVLELGGNIGRTTVIINTKLNNSKNLVTFESDPKTAIKLKENLSKNGYDSYVESAAISVQPLIQKTNTWNTKPLDTPEVPEGWDLVTTTTYKDVVNKYQIKFDTLVIDCEGAFYYILRDEPEILDGINLVIIENDFTEIEHKVFVDKHFNERGLKRVLACRGDWGPCIDYFYEVWVR